MSEQTGASVVLAAMADGIGDITFASSEWVEAARQSLAASVETYAEGLADLGKFTLCEVGHNAPVYMHCGPTLAWHAKFDGASVEVGEGELDGSECDFKMQGDHSIISNMARLQHTGRDPKVVAAAQARLGALSRWKIEGELPAHPVLSVVLRKLHDDLAGRTMPRFVFMTPEWVSSARHILTQRAQSEKYAPGIKNTVYTFAEEFTQTPKYAFPDGSHGGFWVNVNYGQITVGAGPLPSEYEPADALTLGEYTPVVPVGRTVNRAMTEAEIEDQKTYSKAAFRFDKVAKKAPVTQSSPSGKGVMPDTLARVFMVLHDELSKRTAGDLPADYDDSITEEWATAQSFDRVEGYDVSWLRYDKVDIYGQPR